MSNILTECVIRKKIGDLESESSNATLIKFFILFSPPFFSRASLSNFSYSSLEIRTFDELVY